MRGETLTEWSNRCGGVQVSGNLFTSFVALKVPWHVINVHFSLFAFGRDNIQYIDIYV